MHMNSELEIIKLIEQYRNEVDSFHHKKNIDALKSTDQIAASMADLRHTCEKWLPELSFKANSLNDGELEKIFSKNQTLYIDDYNYRLEIYRLITFPSERVVKLFNVFKSTVTIE